MKKVSVAVEYIAHCFHILLAKCVGFCSKWHYYFDFCDFLQDFLANILAYRFKCLPLHGISRKVFVKFDKSHKKNKRQNEQSNQTEWLQGTS